THTVETARQLLDLAPVTADALGRALTGAFLLARLLEKSIRKQHITLRFQGDGPMGTMIAEANTAGDARGYVANPVPTDPSLDVSQAIGRGILTVIRGTGPNGKPYTSQTLLEGGGVAQELTRYLAQSEQIGSAVLLGVFERREGVAAAGGIIVQAFPHASEQLIAKIERRIRETPPLSTLLEKMPIEAVVAQVFEGLEYKQLDESLNVPLGYNCTCTRDRALAPLQLFSRQELVAMIEDGGSEVVCQYCGRKYAFTADELLALSPVRET
ncbi:MAG: Hsp33 family molecular chaperone HslO, partial [Acidobacteriota bacterium]